MPNGPTYTLRYAHTIWISTSRAEGRIGPSRPELIAAIGGGGTLVYVTIISNERPHISGHDNLAAVVYIKKKKASRDEKKTRH